MDRARGLDDAKARERLRHEGANELRLARRDGVLGALAGLLREPLFALLFAATGLYFWLGDRTEAIALLASAAVAAAIHVFQKVRTGRVLEALRELSSPRALVLREGRAVRIPAREVVREDVLLLREGDRVPADATVDESLGLQVDESLLTGEAVAVPKFAGATVHASTLVVAGQGRAFVTATGARTAFGLIGTQLMSLRDARTPLQRDTARLARVFGGAGLALSVALAVGYGLVEGRWADGVLRGLTLAMAILPEEFPLVITVFLALGAWRLARHRVLARRPDAIEALGAATVLCVDKTGTLTLNRMALARALPLAGTAEADLAAALAMACEPQPFDPMEQAALQWAGAHGGATPPAANLHTRYPLREDRLVVGHAWREDGAAGEAGPATRWRLAAKGAPEHVLALCAPDPAQREAVLASMAQLGAAGLRVLAVASAEAQGATPPADIAGLAWRLHGLVAFEDPLRDTVPQAMADCRRAGIRVLVITGDYPATAEAVARAAGVADAPRVVTGAEIAGWDDATLALRLPQIHVVARATPLTKLRLVQSLQGRGEVVAMTGDGVNDAPALRAAHIGVAMGTRGSDVARESAGLVLMDDDFGALVAGVRRGRTLFANLRQALLYVLAVHVPMIGASVLPLLAGGPALLLPMHVMFLEFVIDPACSLAFEAERPGGDAMARPPRPAHERVLGRREFTLAFGQGAIALGAVLVVWALARLAGAGDAALRGVTMTAIIAMNLALIVLDRSSEVSLRAHLGGRNPVLWALLAGTVAAWAAVLAAPPARALFGVDAPSVAWLAWLLPGLGAGVAGLVVFTRAGRRAPQPPAGGASRAAPAAAADPAQGPARGPGLE